MDNQSALPRDPLRRLLFTEDGHLIGEIVFGLDEDGTPQVYVQTSDLTRLTLSLDDLTPDKRHFILRDSTSLHQLRRRKSA